MGERRQTGERRRTSERQAATERLYTAVGDLIERISHGTIGEYGYTRVGAVVGATYPEEAAFLRARLKNTFFLVPGYGAQGGSAAEAARAFEKNGHGAIINSSRAIIAAWKKTGSAGTTAASGNTSAAAAIDYAAAARDITTAKMDNAAAARDHAAAAIDYAAAARDEALRMRDELRRVIYR